MNYPGMSDAADAPRAAVFEYPPRCTRTNEREFGHRRHTAQDRKDQNNNDLKSKCHVRLIHLVACATNRRGWIVEDGRFCFSL